MTSSQTLGTMIDREEISPIKVAGKKKGYYRSPSVMALPWCVRVAGQYLKDKRGNLRRFSSSAKAYQAGRAALAKVKS